MCRDPIRWNNLHSKTDDNWYFPMITVCTTLVAHTLGVTLFKASRLLHYYLQLSMTEKSLCFEGTMQMNLSVVWRVLPFPPENSYNKAK